MAEVTNDLKSILSADQMSESEIIRAIRVSIKAEIDAVHLYDMIAESTNDERVARIMLQTAKEERVHIGEFMRLLQELNPNEMRDYNEGAAEAENIISTGNNSFESKRVGKNSPLTEWNQKLDEGLVRK